MESLSEYASKFSIPKPRAIAFLVPEKMFGGFTPYIAVVAMWSYSMFSSYGCSRKNLTSNGHVVFENWRTKRF